MNQFNRHGQDSMPSIALCPCQTLEIRIRA
jgi:hypothetical protein